MKIVNRKAAVLFKSDDVIILGTDDGEIEIIGIDKNSIYKTDCSVVQLSAHSENLFDPTFYSVDVTLEKIGFMVDLKTHTFKAAYVNYGDMFPHYIWFVTDVDV